MNNKMNGIDKTDKGGGSPFLRGPGNQCKPGAKFILKVDALKCMESLGENYTVKETDPMTTYGMDIDYYVLEKGSNVPVVGCSGAIGQRPNPSSLTQLVGSLFALGETVGDKLYKLFSK